MSTRTTLDRCKLADELYSQALTHRHSSVREVSLELHDDMINDYDHVLTDCLIRRRYTELQALIARCRRIDRERARQRHRDEALGVLGLLMLCALVAGVVVAAVLA